MSSSPPLGVRRKAENKNRFSQGETASKGEGREECLGKTREEEKQVV